MAQIFQNNKVIPIRMLNYREAKEHVPLIDTYAIRIFYHSKDMDEEFGDLINSKLYVETKPYRFDDVYRDEEQEEGCGEDFYPITNEIARKMLTDFMPYRDKIEELLIHCMYGLNRTPAVAMAFNNIFNLGNSTELIKRKFSGYNPKVYDILMRNRDVI